jgi:hypothetical protein
MSSINLDTKRKPIYSHFHRHNMTWHSPKPKSKLLYDWRSVGQYVLVSRTVVGLLTRYYFRPTQPISKRSILILSTHLRLNFPSGLSSPGFPTYNLYVSIFSLIRATCSVHLILLDLIILILLNEEYKSRSSSLCSFSTLLSLHTSLV